MFDGPLAPVPCASQTAYVPCADCPNEAVCGVHLAMKDVRDATARVLDGTSLACLRGQVAQATALTATQLTTLAALDSQTPVAHLLPIYSIKQIDYIGS